MNKHAGQVSFPGGRAEPSDKNTADTALREAQEELGIDPSLVEVVGELDDFDTVVTDFNVAPIVGVLTQAPSLTPSPTEVADYFWVPLASLARKDAWRFAELTHEGRLRHVWYYDDAPHVIWGATAAMLRQFLEWTCDMR